MKNTYHYSLRKLHHVKPVYLLIPTIIFFGLSVYGLRDNNFKMIELRQAVITADEQNGDVETALQNLRGHVHGHMNTNLNSGNFAIKPPIQLKGRYERLMKSEEARIKSLNEEVTRQAEAQCGSQFPGQGFNAPRVSCIQDYVARNASQTNDIAQDLYKFDFVSPRWSPDLAGISIVLGALFGLASIIRLALAKIR